MLNPTIFREYDIRGTADSDLHDEGIGQLGQALGTYMQRHAGKRVAVGRDVRLSGPRLAEALIRGLTASGCDVTELGVVPTPLLYYSTFHLKTNGAVMITGSHNPPQYNGFKAVCGGAAIYGETIQDLRRMIERQDFLRGNGSRTAADVVTPYVEEVAAQFRFARRIKVVVDCGNGVAGPTLRRLFEKLNVDVTELFFEPDGNFPNHHPDPTVISNLRHLVHAVKEQGADFGIGFDGDGDRLGAVDEQGRVVFGDMLMLIYAREILTRKPGATFIAEVKCSQVLYDQLRKLGGNPIMYRTGHSLIKAKMKEVQAELAGEMSGHMFFADRYYGYDDALYAACRLIEIVAASGKPLSAQFAGLPHTVATPEIRVECADEIKFGVVKKAAEDLRRTREIIDVDGARVIFPHGWGLVRASNTQPVLVLRFEAEDEQLLAAYRGEVEAAIGRLIPVKITEH